MAYNNFQSDGFPRTLQGPILINDYGLPRYWVVVWCCFLTNGLKHSTKSKELRYIDDLYKFSEKLYGIGYLDKILTNGDIDNIGNLLESFYISLQNEEKLNNSIIKKWKSCVDFVQDIVRYISPNILVEYSNKQELSIINSLYEKYGQLSIQISKNAETLRSLPSSVVEALYYLLDIDSQKNPFKRPLARWNAFIFFRCALHCGFRRGEILLLPVNAVKSEFDNKSGKIRYWINVTIINDHIGNDTRHNKPGIKTPTSYRQVPISDITANLIQSYTDNIRGKPNHPFLLNSQKNTPLSQETISYYFGKINHALPLEVKLTLSNRSRKDIVEPHDLRHTCAVVRLNQFLIKYSMEESLQQMRTFFGWSRESDMPLRYARAVFEDRLSSVWSDIFDDHIELLRNIPKGV
jgi:integrase